MAARQLSDAVREFGIAARAKLSNPAISGAPEDQLRAPLEGLIRSLAELVGLGAGFIDMVTPAMWGYEVSGVEVLKHWFSYRREDRSRPVIGDRRPPSPLERIRPDGWLDEYTQDLMDLLNVLGRLINLEPAQAILLDDICAGSLYSAEELAKLWTAPVPSGETVR